MDLLPFAEVAYNNSVHQSTGFSPFRVVFGQDFVPIPELPQKLDDPLMADDWISNWPVMLQTLQEAKEDYKRFADQKRTPEWDLSVGYKVYLSTKHLKSTQPSKKLGPQFVGPFPITKVINPVTV